MQPCSVRLIANGTLEDLDRRQSPRFPCQQETTARPLESTDTLGWGAQVRDVSQGGVGLTLCFPFRPGTYLSLDLRNANGSCRSFLARVLHARDQADGTWHLGCEWVNAIAEDDLEMLLQEQS